MKLPHESIENPVWDHLLFWATIPLMLIGGWVRSLVWLWFAVPLGAIPLTPLQMTGLFLLYRSFFIGGKERIDSRELVCKCVANLAITLSLGYTLHLLNGWMK